MTTTKEASSAVRDELARLISSRHTMAAVDAILSAGYRKPRTITTVEGLDALPDEIILRSGGVTYEHHDGWFHGVDGSNVVAESISLPAAILWEPEAEALR